MRVLKCYLWVSTKEINKDFPLGTRWWWWCMYLFFQHDFFSHNFIFIYFILDIYSCYFCCFYSISFFKLLKHVYLVNTRMYLRINIQLHYVIITIIISSLKLLNTQTIFYKQIYHTTKSLQIIRWPDIRMWI